MLIVKRWPSQYMPGTPESNKEDLGDSPMLYIGSFLIDSILNKDTSWMIKHQMMVLHGGRTDATKL